MLRRLVCCVGLAIACATAAPTLGFGEPLDNGAAFSVVREQGPLAASDNAGAADLSSGGGEPDTPGSAALPDQADASNSGSASSTEVPPTQDGEEPLGTAREAGTASSGMTDPLADDAQLSETAGAEGSNAFDAAEASESAADGQVDEGGQQEVPTPTDDADEAGGSLSTESRDSTDDLDALAAQQGSAISDGTYLIKASIGVGKVLDVKSGSTADKANVQIYTSNGTDAQSWRIECLDDGYVVILNIGSGKALDVASGRAESGTNVQQYARNDTRAQKWLPVLQDDGSYVFFSALGGNLVLDVSGASSANGANVQVYNSNGTQAQRFTVEPCELIAEPCIDYGLTGWYTIVSALDGSYVVDVTGASGANGANIQLYRSNGTTAQLFRFVWSSGWYRIETAMGGALDVAEGSSVPGTNVQQWKASATNRNQQWTVERHEDGGFTFVNRATGLALDVHGGVAANSRNINAYAPNDSAAQRFFLERCDALMPEGVFELQSALSGSLVADVASCSAASGANVQIYARNGSPAQKWDVRLASADVGSYTLQSIGSGLYLAVDGTGNVCQLPKSVGDRALWLPDLANGSYVLRNVATGKALDVTGGSAKSGTNVQTYTANGTIAQSFSLKSTDLLGTGTYVIRSSMASGKVLDVKGASSSNGANVQLYSENGTGAQKWRIAKGRDGLYTITNCNSGKVLDVANGKAFNGANVQQYGSNGTAAQKWRLSWDAASGGLVFASAIDPSFALDIKGASTANGANAQLYEANRTQAQAFTLKPTTYQPDTVRSRMESKAQGYSSSTNWLIMVDTTSNYLGVFRGSRGNWKVDKYWICSTGKKSTPTVLGQFTVTGKGYSFGHGYTCYYYTQFYGDYLIHSVKYYQGTFRVLDGRMGVNISEGCVRLPLDRAKWIYDTIPYGTKVVTYR